MTTTTMATTTPLRALQGPFLVHISSSSENNFYKSLGIYVYLHHCRYHPSSLMMTSTGSTTTTSLVTAQLYTSTRVNTMVVRTAAQQKQTCGQQKREMIK